jgi:hypothetical protein
MFDQMLNGSRAVLLRPSVATFEEHERNDLGWALIYIALGAVVAAILGAIRFALHGPAMEQALRQFQNQLGSQPLPPGFDAFMGVSGLIATIITSLFGTLFWFFIWSGIVYLLGRAFGGTGAYGELAYDIALFQAPLGVISGLVSLIGFGPLVCLTGLIGFALWIYGFYLTWLSVQSGMNLPGNKALFVILLPILIVLLLCCGLSALILAWITLTPSQ